MSNFLNDELQQMDEIEQKENPDIEEAVSINDPIRTLKMQKMVLVDRGTTIDKVVALFQSEGVACVLVTDNEKLAGIFTERDVIRKLIGEKVDITTVIVDDYMTSDPDTLGMSDSIAFALNRMYDGGYRHVPIVNSANNPVGIVSVLDVIVHLAVYFSSEVLNLPPTPQRKAQKRPEGG